MLTTAKLSDLFFNYRNDNYDQLFATDGKTPTAEDIEKAVKADATEFAELYPEFGMTAEWYAKDFLGRL